MSKWFDSYKFFFIIFDERICRSRILRVKFDSFLLDYDITYQLDRSRHPDKENHTTTWLKRLLFFFDRFRFMYSSKVLTESASLLGIKLKPYNLPGIIVRSANPDGVYRYLVPPPLANVLYLSVHQYILHQT